MPRPVAIELLSTGLDASCYSSSAAREAVYVQISRDIRMMEETILELKKRHNSLCIVERLPSELLATIFKWIASMERNTESCKWLRVGKVCAKWRRVALDCPALWCFYRSANLEWLDIVLRRSGTLPLYVDQDLSRKSSKGLRRALGEAQRIRELSFVGCCVKQWKKLCKALVKSEPPLLLESFQARIRYGQTETFPDNLFKGQLPRLKALKLDGLLIGNNAALLPHLTTLTLRHSEASENSRLPLSQLMGILRQAPNLEFLQLHDVCEEIEEVDITSLPTADVVQLPRLQHIDFTGRMCTAILFQITHPTPIAHIALNISYSSVTERSAHALCANLATRIRPVHHLQVKSCYRIQDYYTFWGEENSSLDPPPSAVADLDFHVSFWRSTDRLQASGSLMRTILERISLAALQVLDVDVDATLTRHWWLDTFGDLEKLTTIRVNNTMVPTLLQALKKTYPLMVDVTGIQLSRRRTRPSFKFLRVLVIERWSCDSSNLVKLTKCLSARRRCGSKLQRLSIIQGTFTGPNPSDAVAKLRKNVTEVIWDVEIIAPEQSQDKDQQDEDKQSTSSNEVESWDYSSSAENFPYRISPGEVDD